jgi:hypothetical protein
MQVFCRVRGNRLHVTTAQITRLSNYQDCPHKPPVLSGMLIKPLVPQRTTFRFLAHNIPEAFPPIQRTEDDIESCWRR